MIAPLLELVRMTVRFGGLTAVNQVDCAVKPGEIFSIIGPNGAGKTTVFNAITGVYEPTSGQILFHGAPLGKPMSWKVISSCALAALAIGLVAALLSLNLDTLWLAAIQRNYSDPKQPFSYAQAW